MTDDKIHAAQGCFFRAVEALGRAISAAGPESRDAALDAATMHASEGLVMIGGEVSLGRVG